MKKTTQKGFSSSIFSSEIRGRGGNPNYRGNCCPGIIEAFIRQYNMSYLSDYAMGSGTTKDVCTNLGVNGYWTDLRLGFDLMNHAIPDCPDNIFYHPPYWNMNEKIIYSNTEYDWKKVQELYGYDPRVSDLSQLSTWDAFLKALNYTVMKQYAALSAGGRFGILMGDIKTKGTLKSMLLEIAKPGTTEQVIIKTQHNCISDRTSYSGTFIPTIHEYFLILRKDSPYMLDFLFPKKIALDIRDSVSVTWKDIVAAALTKLNKKATLPQIYAEVENHQRAKTNAHWKEKIRQTLQIYDMFQSLERGIWTMAA